MTNYFQFSSITIGVIIGVLAVAAILCVAYAIYSKKKNRHTSRHRRGTGNSYAHDSGELRSSTHSVGAQPQSMNDAPNADSSMDIYGATHEQIEAVNTDNTGNGQENICSRSHYLVNVSFMNIGITNASISSDYKPIKCDRTGLFNYNLLLPMSFIAETSEKQPDLKQLSTECKNIVQIFVEHAWALFVGSEIINDYIRSLPSIDTAIPVPDKDGSISTFIKYLHELSAIATAPGVSEAVKESYYDIMTYSQELDMISRISGIRIFRTASNPHVYSLLFRSNEDKYVSMKCKELEPTNLYCTVNPTQGEGVCPLFNVRITLLGEQQL